jgi:ADP-ribose pyrophosphatase YjhB (NUDIX family)
MPDQVPDRTYPDRPYVAVSAAIIRDGKVLIVRRANAPAYGMHTLPGGIVESGETLTEALRREIEEETGLLVEPVALAGHREVIARDPDGRVKRHFIILAFAARWLAGELRLNEELHDAKWLYPLDLTELETTEGLAEIVDVAFSHMVDTEMPGG